MNAHARIPLNLTVTPALSSVLKACAAKRNTSVSALVQGWAEADPDLNYHSPEHLAGIVESFWRIGPEEGAGPVWWDPEPDADGVRRVRMPKTQRELCVDYLATNTHLDRPQAEAFASAADWENREPWPRPPTPEELQAQRHWDSAVQDAVNAINREGAGEEEVIRLLLEPGRFRPHGFNSYDGAKIYLQARGRIALADLNTNTGQ